MSRTLVIGGTFNPVHIGHLRLAVEACEAMAFDRVEWIPCFAPHHKNGAAVLPFALRRELLCAATAEFAHSRVNDIESRLSTPSYTFQTLEALRTLEPAAEYHFILGSEEFSHLHTWYRGRALISLAHIVVATRTGIDPAAFRRTVEEAWPDSRPIAPPSGTLAGYELTVGHRAVLLPLPHIEISSTLIRQRWLAGRNLHLLLPPPVLDVLETHRGLVTRVWGEKPTAG